MTWEALLLSSCLLVQLITFAVVAWAVLQYIRARRQFVNIATPIRRIMQMDELIDELLDADTGSAVPASAVAVSEKQAKASDAQKHRERLAALAAGGQAKQYLGKALTADQVDSLAEDEVEKLYAHYEARLGAAMTKTLGQAALQLYAGVASMFLPIPPENQPALVADLETDPFVGHALSSAACELYHRYGVFLAPLTTAITTAKHCQFEHQRPQTIVEDGGREPTSSDATGGKSDYSGAE